MKKSIITKLLLIVLAAAAIVFLLRSLDISNKYRPHKLPLPAPSQLSLLPSISSEPLQKQSEDILPELPAIPVITYDHSLPVPENEPVSDEYFERCVFIGDSRMLGLIKYTGIKPLNYCSAGFSINQFNGKKFVRTENGDMTVKDALIANDDYDAVYISTGINELGWKLSVFKDRYDGVIKEIKEVAGDRPIYIQLVLPVTTDFETSATMNPFHLSNSMVGAFNDSLREIAVQNSVYYLDCSGFLLLEDGTLDPAKSSDGAHLTKSAYKEQLDYYKKHTAVIAKTEEDPMI